jgi:hypothetical protein
MRTVRMTQQLQPGDFALVTSGSMLGESVQLVELIKPGQTVTLGDRAFPYQPRPALAAWLVQGRESWSLKSPTALMPLRSPVSNPEGAE